MAAYRKFVSKQCNSTIVSLHDVDHRLKTLNASYNFEEISCDQLTDLNSLYSLRNHRPLLLVARKPTIDFVNSVLLHDNAPSINIVDTSDFLLLRQANVNLCFQMLATLLLHWTWGGVHLYISNYYYVDSESNILKLRQNPGINGNLSVISTHIAEMSSPTNFIEFLQSGHVPHQYIVLMVDSETVLQIMQLANDGDLLTRSQHWLVFYSGNMDLLYNKLNLKVDSQVFVVRHRGHIKDFTDLMVNYVKHQGSHSEGSHTLRDPKDVIATLMMNDIVLEVIELTETSQDPMSRIESHRVAVWTVDSGLRLFPNPQFKNFHKKSIRIAISESPPYVFLSRNWTNSLEPSGYLVDVINVLAVTLNFIPEYVDANENIVQTPTYNGTWNGIIDLLVKKEVDLGLFDMAITKERKDLVDFSHVAIDSQTLAGLLRRPSADGDDLQKVGVYFEPFDLKVWVALFVTLVMLISMFYGSVWISRRLPTLKERAVDDGTVDVSRSVLLGVQAVAQQGCEFDVFHPSGRVFFAVLWFFALITYSAYSATLMSYLTISRVTWPFKTIQELTNNKDYRIGLMRGSQQLMMIRESKSTDYNLLWRRMVRDKMTTLVSTLPEGINRASREKLVFLLDDRTLQYVSRNTCDLVVSDPLSKPFYVALPFQKESPYRRSFDQVLRSMSDAGILFRLKEKWWGNSLFCIQDAQVFVTLSMTNVATGFLLLAGGFICCLFILCLEHALYCCKCYKIPDPPPVSKTVKTNLDVVYRRPRHSRNIQMRF